MVSFSSDASCEHRNGEQPHWCAWGGTGQPEDCRDPSHVHATKQLQEGHNSSLQPALEVASRDGTQDIADISGSPNHCLGCRSPWRSPHLEMLPCFPASSLSPSRNRARGDVLWAFQRGWGIPDCPACDLPCRRGTGGQGSSPLGGPSPGKPGCWPQRLPWAKAR